MGRRRLKVRSGAQRVPRARGRRRAHQAQPGPVEDRQEAGQTVVQSPGVVGRDGRQHHRSAPEEFRLIPIIGSAAGLRQGEMFGLSDDDFDFEERVIRIRRQVKRLGREFVFALPKNDKEPSFPCQRSWRRWSRSTSRVSVRRQSRCRGSDSTASSRTTLCFSPGQTASSSAHACTTWWFGNPALATAGVIPPPVKDQ